MLRALDVARAAGVRPGVCSDDGAQRSSRSPSASAALSTAPSAPSSAPAPGMRASARRSRSPTPSNARRDQRARRPARPSGRTAARTASATPRRTSAPARRVPSERAADEARERRARPTTNPRRQPVAAMSTVNGDDEPVDRRHSERPSVCAVTGGYAPRPVHACSIRRSRAVGSPRGGLGRGRVRGRRARRRRRAVPTSGRVADRFARAWERGRLRRDVRASCPRTRAARAGRARFAALHRAAPGHRDRDARGLTAARAKKPQRRQRGRPGRRPDARSSGPSARPLVLPMSGSDGDAARRLAAAPCRSRASPPGERADAHDHDCPPRADLLARDGTVARRRARPHAVARSADVAADDRRRSSGPPRPSARRELHALGYPTDSPSASRAWSARFDERLAGRRAAGCCAGARAAGRARPAPGRRRAHDDRAERPAGGGRRAGRAPRRRRRAATRAPARSSPSPASRFRGLQPPGSTFKIITLDRRAGGGHRQAVGQPSPSQTAATLEGVELENANGESCGGTLANVLRASPATRSSRPLGAKLGAERLVATAERFGFNRAARHPGAATSTIPRGRRDRRRPRGRLVGDRPGPRAGHGAADGDRRGDDRRCAAAARG